MNALRYVWPACLSGTLVATGAMMVAPETSDIESTVAEAVRVDEVPVDVIPTDAGSGGPECLQRPLSITRNVIADDADGSRGVAAGDIDGDLDNDIVGVSTNDDTVAWYENDGGSPPSWTKHVIFDAADGADSVAAVDLDGDGDVDVIAGSRFDDTVRWFENDGLNPPGFTTRVLATADDPRSVFAVDLDDDGDVDVIVGSSNDDTVAWYESDGGTPPTFTQRVITTTADRCISVVAFDIDNDGDLDVVAGWNSSVEWYESDGAADPTFMPHLVTDTLALAQSVAAADLDNDLDGDILSASLIDNTVAWYENDGGVFTKRIINDASSRPTSVVAAFLDGDGNVDVLSVASNNDRVSWYQSDGGSPPNFTEFVITTQIDNAQAIVAADIDGDLQLDAVTASLNDDLVTWFRLSNPEYGVCCLDDGSCLDLVCLAECASLLAWRWEPDLTCAETTCPGAPTSLFLVEQLSPERFRSNIEHLAAYGTRYWNTQGNADAVQWLKERLEAYGYDNVTLDPYTFLETPVEQVYATKIGKTRPGEMYIVGAHMDSFNINGNQDDAPGADDDASGTSSVLEFARILARVETDVSIRVVLWNNEETGLNGSMAYVQNHKDLQGTPDEPVWLGMVQQDMIMYDRFPIRDQDVEYQATADADGNAIILAAFMAGAMERYGTGDFPAEVGPNMRNTDSVPFMTEIPAISVRENRRDEIGNGSNPHWHQPTDRPETYTDEDYLQGYNSMRMVAGAISELAGARPNPCPADIDRDGQVGFSDLNRVLANWGSDVGGLEDLDDNMDVGFSDLLAVIAAWGPC